MTCSEVRLLAPAIIGVVLLLCGATVTILQEPTAVHAWSGLRRISHNRCPPHWTSGDVNDTAWLARWPHCTNRTRSSGDNTSSVAANKADTQPDILVVILAQTRAWEVTWDAFRTNVLDYMHADLAVCVGRNHTAHPGPATDAFTLNAKYVWEFEELVDYSDAFDWAANISGAPPRAWREMLRIKDQLFGGVLDPVYHHTGSSGILLFFRWFLLHSMEHAGIDKLYKWFIITRSDFFYPFPHPDPRHLEEVEPGRLWLPTGEHYEGLGDRHIVVRQSDLHPALNLMDDILFNSTALFLDMNATRQNWNLERYIDYHFIKVGIRDRASFFPRCMFTVRREVDTTRWSVGHWHKELGVYVKYPEEYEATKTNMLAYEFNKRDWTQLLIPK